MSQILSVMKSVFLIGCAVDRLVSRLTAEYTLKRTHRIPDSAQNGGIRYSHAGKHGEVTVGYAGQSSVNGILSAAGYALIAGICYAIFKRKESESK